MAMTPKPKTVRVECEVCGQDWAAHKADGKGIVRLDECVRLLKNELRRRPAFSTPTTWSSIPMPGTNPITAQTITVS